MLQETDPVDIDTNSYTLIFVLVVQIAGVADSTDPDWLQVH